MSEQDDESSPPVVQIYSNPNGFPLTGNGKNLHMDVC